MYDLDILHDGSYWPCPGQVQRLSSQVKVHNHWIKMFHLQWYNVTLTDQGNNENLKL